MSGISLVTTVLSLVYYKLFDENEPCELRHPVYSNNPYIGRVDANVIPPPHGVFPLVKCICDKEGKGYGLDWDNDDAFSTVLFKTISSPKPFDLEGSLQLLNDERPGSTPEEPVILKVGYEGMSNSRCLLIASF